MRKQLEYQRVPRLFFFPVFSEAIRQPDKENWEKAKKFQHCRNRTVPVMNLLKCGNCPENKPFLNWIRKGRMGETLINTGFIIGTLLVLF